MKQLTPLAALLSLFSLLFVAQGCAPADDGVDDPMDGDPATCEEVLAAWQSEMPAPDPDATPVMLSAQLRDADRNEVRAAADADSETFELVDVGTSVVLALPDAQYVHGLRYTPRPGEAALTDFEIYLSPTADCWGEPAAVGSFDGSEYAQEVVLDGLPGRYVRIDIRGATEGASRAGIAELAVLVGASVESEPDANAIVGVEWTYQVDGVMPGEGPLGYEIVTGPSDMSADDDGFVTWLPAEGDEGAHDVTIRLSRGDAFLDQTFAIDVAGRRVVGSAPVSEGGGTVTIDTSSDEEIATSEVVVTVEDSSAPAGTIEVHAVESESPMGIDDETGELTALGVPFIIETDLPPGTRLTIRIPLASIDGFPSADPRESLFLTAYPQEFSAHGDESLSRWGFWESITETAAVAWEWVAGEDPEVFQVNKGVSITYVIDEFEIEYMLDSGEAEAPAQAQLMWVGEQLVAARQHFAGLGCRPRASQKVQITGTGKAVGSVAHGSLLFKIGKSHLLGHPRTSVQATIAHELLHTYQLADFPGQTPPAGSKWWTEGNAAFSEDEVFDTNDWFRFYGPWTQTQSRTAIIDVRYRNIGYWKSLKAQRGFNVCEFIDAAVASDGLTALTTVLGGEDAVLESFTTFIAAYNHVREPSVLDDANVFFTSGQMEFGDGVSGSISGDYREYLWKRMSASNAGGESAQLALEEEGTMEIEVRQPSADFLLFVYDHEENLLGEVRAGDGMTSFEVSGDKVYLDIGILPGTAAVDIEVFARISATGECSSTGAPCSGSGSAFDDECCGDQICVVGACRANSGGRERASCGDTLGCASGLICNEVGSAEAADSCCARDLDYCETKNDCCGLMDCVSNRCVGRTSGEACLSGDCVGVSFCDGGTCT